MNVFFRPQRAHAYKCACGKCAFFLILAQIVIVLSLVNPTDLTSPVFIKCPSDIRASINENKTASVNWTKPVAVDNSNLEPNMTVVPRGIIPPYIFNETAFVVYTATDASGNKAECSFKVILEGKPDIDSHFCGTILNIWHV